MHVLFSVPQVPYVTLSVDIHRIECEHCNHKRHSKFSHLQKGDKSCSDCYVGNLVLY